MARRFQFSFFGMVFLTAIGVVSADKSFGQGGRTYTSGHFALELDGAFAGWLSSAEGGNPVGEVVTDASDTEGAKKHIGQVKYENLSVSFGVGMSKDFYQWIQDSMDGRSTRKSGSVIFLDRSFQQTSRMTFANALIAEIAMPALDAASKDVAYMTIKLSPETIRRVPGRGGVYAQDQVKNQKTWLPANFRLKIDGLDQATARVLKIDAFSIKQGATSIIPTKEPTKLEYPNIAFSSPETDCDDLYKWEDSFLVKGENSDKSERRGSLSYLADDMKTVLFQLDFSGMGLVKLTADKPVAGADGIKKLKVELYVEQMRLSSPAANM